MAASRARLAKPQKKNWIVVVTLQGTITYPTLRKRNTSSKMPWEKESPAPGDRHCCLKDFGRSTRHDVWRPYIFIHSGKLILVLHLRR